MSNLKSGALSVKMNLSALWMMAKRNLRLFLKDKVTVFFSLLSPLIVFMLYLLFLQDIQLDTIRSMLPQGLDIADKSIRTFANTWMVSGTLSVACITVSLSANSVMVADKSRGIVNDFMVSPVKKWAIKLSYFVSNFLVTLCICSIVLVVCILYLVITNAFALTFTDILLTICVMILSIISATFMTVFVASFFKTESALGAVTGIFSAVSGFIIGAYMPLSIFPTMIQYIALIFPGTHSGGLFRIVLLRGPLALISEGAPIQFAEALESAFGMKLSFFGSEAGWLTMMLVLLGSIVLFLTLNLVFGFNKPKHRYKSNLPFSNKKSK